VSHNPRKVLGNKLRGTVCDFLDKYPPCGERCIYNVSSERRSNQSRFILTLTQEKNIEMYNLKYVMFND
jgi:hypothetical protein